MIVDMVRTEIGRHKMRSVLTITGIVIGILLITSMVAFSEGLQVSLGEGLDMLEGRITIVEGSEGMSLTSMMSSELDEDIVADLEAHSDIKDVAPMIAVQTSDGWLQGFNWEENIDLFESFDLGFEEGGPYKTDTDEVILGTLAAKQSGASVGDTVKYSGEIYEVVGILESVGNPQDDSSVMTSVKTVQKITGNEGVLTAIIVTPYDTSDTESVAQRLEDDFDDISALVDKDVEREAQNLIGQINVMLYSIGSIASLIAAIVIMNVMFMSVRERTREIGTMKALGATNRQILLEIIGEAVFMALLGGVIGLGLSALAVVALNSAIGSEMALITPRLAAGSLLFACLLGVVGGVLPARSASRLDPIVALRYE